MIELLLDDHISRVRVVRIVGFIVFSLGEVYLSLSLVASILTATSPTVVVVTIKASLGPSPRILLEPFGHTVPLKVAYFITSPASYIDASSWPSSRVFFFLLLL